MNCRNCKSYYPDDEKSCPYCGYVMSEDERKSDKKRRQEEASKRKVEPGVVSRYKAEQNKIVSVVLLGTEEKRGKNVLGTAGRMLVGGALAGTFGAALGMVSSKDVVKSKKAVFAVRYASGKVETVRAEIGSAKYQELVKFIV